MSGTKEQELVIRKLIKSRFLFFNSLVIWLGAVLIHLEKGILCLEGWQTSQRKGTVCSVLLTVLTCFLVSSDLVFLFSACDPPSSFALTLFYLFGFPISMLGLISSFAGLAVLLVAAGVCWTTHDSD